MNKLIIMLLLASCSNPVKKEMNRQEQIENIPSVKIGSQIWSNNNLSVDTFQNGDQIYQAKTIEEWNDYSDQQQAVWCYYNFDSTNNTLHGKLYNWYAINDERGIAPSGWHVATNEDWELLIKTTGEANLAAIKLKSTTGWANDGLSNNGTDDYEFGALPTGELHTDGVFSSLDEMGVWWTSSSYEGPVRWGQKKGDQAWDVVIWYSETMPVKLQPFPKKGSGAIRLVQNK